ncbi:hypothetical protein CCP4SC76_5720004 [Gammaproteobacteria bacterium]
MNTIRVSYEMSLEEDEMGEHGEHASRFAPDWLADVELYEMRHAVTDYPRKGNNARHLYSETEDERKPRQENGLGSRRYFRKYRGRSQHSQG